MWNEMITVNYMMHVWSIDTICDILAMENLHNIWIVSQDMNPHECPQWLPIPFQCTEAVFQIQLKMYVICCVYGSGHEGGPVLLPGFAIIWLQNQVSRQAHLCDLTQM